MDFSRAPASSREVTAQIGTNGTVTNGAVNFAQICVNFAKTISQVFAKLRKFRAHFAQIRQIVHVPAFFGLTPPFITPPFVPFQ